MKKTLIYMPKNKLKPTGGPAGYLYNLYSQFELDGIRDVYFLDSNDGVEQYRNIYAKLPNCIKNIYRIVARNKQYKKLISGEANNRLIDLNEYENIHFHSTRDLYREKENLKNFNGKVILTSHTPKPPHLEAIEDNYTNLEKVIYGKKRLNEFKRMDEYAFDIADYIVFPCEDAEEPYYKNWNEYSSIKEKNKAKYRYLLSGTREGNVKTNRIEILDRFKIPKDAFIISYVGRHNEVKGYDLLKEIGEAVLSKYKNVYFLIAGVEKPLTGLTHERWIEVGWTSEPHSIIAASDLFILPNKETYFDLVMLEVLSLGKIVVASNTGGNKYFKKIDAEGILTYENIKEALDLIDRIKELPDNKKVDLENKNKNIFREYFSNEVFAKNYIDLINSLD